METTPLKRFAQYARRSLIEQVSAKLKQVLAEDSAARRENPRAVAEIEKVISHQPSVISKDKKNADNCTLNTEGLIERVAYIWFNRFCALRFMDVNRYNRVGIVSPADPGQFQPEILAEAKMGHIDEEMVQDKIRQQIFALLDGKAPSRDPQGEAYRLLVVAACNFWNKAMPFLFQRIDDYTELLMPDDLLSGNSILAYTREAMTPDACEDVEVIGWLYQFYISEKKDEVFDGLKKNKKITPENIPAATQLFTPHWIVRYLVENSLGRLWMLNRPNSRLVDRMEYYIRPDTSHQPSVVSNQHETTDDCTLNTDYLRVSSPEEIRICDPACGSGHMLTYAFDLLYAIYEEEGYEPAEIPEKILTHNLYGIEIDERAGELAAFALTMKARAKQRRFFNKEVKPNICVLDKSVVDTQELLTYLEAQGVLHPSQIIESFFKKHTIVPLLRQRYLEKLAIFEDGFDSLKHHPCSKSLLARLNRQLNETLDLFESVIDHSDSSLLIKQLLVSLRDKNKKQDLKDQDIHHALTSAALPDELKTWLSAKLASNKPSACLKLLDELQGIVAEMVGHSLLFSPLQELNNSLIQHAQTVSQLRATLFQFEEADNFGSLIRPDVTDVDGMLRILESKNVSGQLFISMTHQKVLQALRQADYLSPKYHVVIANPPYMGGKGMNGRLGAWVKDNYPNSKSDLFAMFIERNLDLVQKHGAVAMITMQSWMFLSSFEALRARLLGQNTLLSMAHLGARAFDSIGGEVVSTTAFVLENSNRLDYKGGYLRLVTGNSEAEKNDAIREAVKNPDYGWFYRASAADFKKIPGSPIAYWIGNAIRSVFSDSTPLDSVSDIKQGLATCNNDLFLRLWFEVSDNEIGFGMKSPEEAFESQNKWFPYNKGGGYRKWYGNNEYLVNWKGNGIEIHQYSKLPLDYSGAPVRAKRFYFREGITYGLISSFGFSARRVFGGFVFDVGGSMIFPEVEINKLQGFLGSKLTKTFITILNPTLNYQVGDIQRLPILKSAFNKISFEWGKIIELAKLDWDAYETSWDFTSLPLQNPDYLQPTLKATYQKLRAHWREMMLEMQQLEQENNRIFIDAYGLQDELTPDVPLNEITLTCNPHYRYGNDKSEDELEALLLADTMRELVSYAVGCMFGRYSLDAPSLILANQGDGIDDYRRIIGEKRKRPESHQSSAISNQQKEQNALTDGCKLPADNSSPGFQPDEDNVIPMLDGDWFTDDIAERFRKFLRVAFGEAHYEENLKFVEQALNVKGKREYSIRDYFLGEFYTDHVKRYKKRPIYWLFSSGSGKSGGSFNALIYMHRYRPDTVSVVLNDYLREFRTKLTSHKNHLEAVSISASASQSEKTKALKEIEKINKIIIELEDYEREVLYPLATQQIDIDLDDGVKVNYPKFGAALKKIVGLDAQDE